jgi:hypothetical protein
MVTLGPVEDLEAHVPPDWWRWIFTPLYLKTDADVVDDENIIAYEVDVLLRLLQPENWHWQATATFITLKVDLTPGPRQVTSLSIN